MRERRLADAGNVLDEQVTAREQARETEAQLRLLAEDDLLERGNRALDQVERAAVGCGRAQGGALHQLGPPRRQPLHAREAPHLLGELRDLAVEIRDTCALLVDDVGRRIRDKARVAQLGGGLVAILLRSLPALLEPAQLGRHVVDEPGERCQHGAPVDQRDRARRQRRLRAHDLDRFQVGHARDRSSERGNCVAIVRQVGPDIGRRGPRMRNVELAADLPHAEHDRAQRLDLAAGLVVRGILLGARVRLQHDAGTAYGPRAGRHAARSPR